MGEGFLTKFLCLVPSSKYHFAVSPSMMKVNNLLGNEQKTTFCETCGHLIGLEWNSHQCSFICFFHFLKPYQPVKEMATHSSILAWRIPGTEEPGGLLSMGSHRVRHHWSNLAAAAYEGASQLALVVKNPPASAGDPGNVSLIPGSGKSPGGGHGSPLQYSCLENSHGQRSLASYTLGSQRVRHDWSHVAHMQPVKKPVPFFPDTRTQGS